MLALHPRGAVDPVLLAKIGALTLKQRDAAAATLVQVAVEAEGVTTRALLAYSGPVGGRCLCALALIGDPANWDEDIRVTAHAIAAMVATQIRHANDMAALGERETLTRALIAGAPDAILAMDARCRLMEFNPAAEELSGYRREDVLGREMSELLIPERDRPRFTEHIRTYLTTGNPGEFTGQMRVPVLRADGTERIVELTPVQVTVNAETMFCGFMRDLTEIEHSHAALADQTEFLNRLIAAAIPGVAHHRRAGPDHARQPELRPHVRHRGTRTAGRHPRRLAAAPDRPRVRRSRRVHPARHRGVQARQPLSGEQMTCADGRTLETTTGRWSWTAAPR